METTKLRRFQRLPMENLEVPEREGPGGSRAPFPAPAVPTGCPCTGGGDKHPPGEFLVKKNTGF